MKDFTWGFVPGAFWGLVVGAAVGTFIGLMVTDSLGTEFETGRAERRSLEQQCIDGKDGACRVLEARR